MADGRIIEKPLDLNELVASIIEDTAEKGAGALVLFVGYVKGRVDDSEVSELDYEAYEPHASRMLKEIAEKYERKEGVLNVRIYHRVGNLKPGETTLYVAVSAKSRHQAFQVAKEALEEVKHRVPIFKLEKREDGEYWVIGNGRRIKRRKAPGSPEQS